MTIDNEFETPAGLGTKKQNELKNQVTAHSSEIVSKQVELLEAQKRDNPGLVFDIRNLS